LQIVDLDVLANRLELASSCQLHVVESKQGEAEGNIESRSELIEVVLGQALLLLNQRLMQRGDSEVCSCDEADVVLQDWKHQVDGISYWY